MRAIVKLKQGDSDRTVLARAFEVEVRQAYGKNKLVVLVVEDEPLIRLGTVAMIEDAGFEVVEAANADEAISILESRNDIRVVFTDIHMPGSMDGLRLAHAVRDRWPPIKLIVTSGQMIVHESELPTGGRFFRKPYQQSALLRVLNELSA